MFLTDKTNEILQLLKDSESLSDAIVIASFPFAYKPTRLQKCLLTVSPHGMKAEQEGIGESRLFGALQIRLTAFVPQDMGSPVAARPRKQTIRREKRNCSKWPGYATRSRRIRPRPSGRLCSASGSASCS